MSVLTYDEAIEMLRMKGHSRDYARSILRGIRKGLVDYRLRYDAESKTYVQIKSHKDAGFCKSTCGSECYVDCKSSSGRGCLYVLAHDVRFDNLSLDRDDIISDMYLKANNLVKIANALDTPSEIVLTYGLNESDYSISEFTHVYTVWFKWLYSMLSELGCPITVYTLCSNGYPDAEVAKKLLPFVLDEGKGATVIDRPDEYLIHEPLAKENVAAIFQSRKALDGLSGMKHMQREIMNAADRCRVLPKCFTGSGELKAIMISGKDVEYTYNVGR